MKNINIVAITTLSLLLLIFSGCSWLSPKVDKTVSLPTLNGELPINGTGLYPAYIAIGGSVTIDKDGWPTFNIDNYGACYKGTTLDLYFRCFNELDIPAKAKVWVTYPNTMELNHWQGFQFATDSIGWVEVGDGVDEDDNLLFNDTLMPANGYKDVIVRLSIPSDVKIPDLWLFDVWYKNLGQNSAIQTQQGAKVLVNMAG